MGNSILPRCRPAKRYNKPKQNQQKQIHEIKDKVEQKQIDDQELNKKIFDTDNNNPVDNQPNLMNRIFGSDTENISDDEDLDSTIPIMTDSDNDSVDSSDYFSFNSSDCKDGDNDDNLLLSSEQFSDTDDSETKQPITLKKNYQNVIKQNQKELETKKREILQKRTVKGVPGRLITVSIKDKSFLEKRLFFFGQTPTNCTFSLECDQFKFKINYTRHMFTSNKFLVDWLEKRFKTSVRAFVRKKYPDRVKQIDNNATLYLRHYDRNLKEMMLIDLKNPRYDLRKYINVSSDKTYYISVVFSSD
jgi:hypothetical protein